MNILIVNDDGYNAVGINKLKEALKPYGNIYIIAPDTQKSGASHSFTYRGPFHLVEKNINEYSLNGMPVDCVRLAKVLDVDFDIVFSGINDGLNLGTDVLYSGTVGAAREAFIEGYAAVALSTDFGKWEIVDNELDKVIKYIFDNKLYSKDYVLNVNFPTGEFSKSKGYKTARVGKKIFNSVFCLKDNAYDILYEESTHDTDMDTDVYLADNGYITFVPLGCDETSYLGLKELNKKILGE